MSTRTGSYFLSDRWAGNKAARAILKDQLIGGGRELMDQDVEIDHVRRAGADGIAASYGVYDLRAKAFRVIRPSATSGC